MASSCGPAAILKQAGTEGNTTHKTVKGAVDDLVRAQKLAEITRDDAKREDYDEADHQYRMGDPVELIAELQAASVDLLLISGLPSSTPATMATKLQELLVASAPIMKPDHQVFVIADLHDNRPLLEVAEFLSYETGVALIWVSDREKSVLDWSAKNSARAILHFRKGNAGLITQIGNVLECDEETFKKHSDQKPLALIQKLVEIATQPGDTVLDPISVAATTNIACRLLGRNCIGITSEQESYDAGMKRLHDNDNTNFN